MKKKRYDSSISWSLAVRRANRTTARRSKITSEFFTTILIKRVPGGERWIR